MLDVRDLRIIRAIADNGSQARAARVLGMGQPALSRLLTAMEARLRGPLFERSRSGVIPTDLCRVALAEGEEILERAKRLNGLLLATRGAQKHELVVIAGHYVAETIGLVAGARLLSIHPALRLRMVATEWPEVPRAVREREAAIGLMDLRELGDAPDLLVEPLRPHPGVFVARAGHPLLAQRALDLAAILCWPLIFPGQIPHRVSDPMAKARDFAQSAGQRHPAYPAMIVASPSAQLIAVRHSDAVAAVTLPVAASLLRDGSLVALPWRAPWVSVHFGIIRPRGQRMTDAGEAYLDLLRQADQAAQADARAVLAGLGLSDETG
ncbi:LysR family transcriptional regulator [Humitalea sp. 24SJ18S-53]|uniref:LysR family transcriptional regulator n=1 Tax=Humitalea sp. 24SJ18S-53 TaxID=3422307 RepID=UPI003D66F4F6